MRTKAACREWPEFVLALHQIPEPFARIGQAYHSGGSQALFLGGRICPWLQQAIIATVSLH